MPDATPDWMEIRILAPPTTPGDRLHEQIVNLFGFKVVDWCLWERPDDKARLTIAPIPAPPPHGFEAMPDA